MNLYNFGSVAWLDVEQVWNMTSGLDYAVINVIRYVWGLGWDTTVYSPSSEFLKKQPMAL